MVNRYCIMYKYNSINHTNEKTEAFYCLKNNYDKEKTKYYTSSLSDNRNHIIVFSQYFRYRRQWKQVRAGRYKRLAADSRAMPGSGIHGRTDKTACLLPTFHQNTHRNYSPHLLKPLLMHEPNFLHHPQSTIAYYPSILSLIV